MGVLSASMTRTCARIALSAAFATAGCDQVQKAIAPGAQSKADQTPAAAPAQPPAKPTAAQLGAPAAADIQAFYAGEFEAFGSEPDWRLDLLDNWVNFSRTGLEDVGGLPGARDVRSGGALVESGPLSIILKAGSCEAAPGQQLPYVFGVYYEGVTYQGCGRRAAAGSAGAIPSWSALLPELLPAIDACAKRVQAQPARVTIAYVIDGGQVNVRFLDGDGGRWECGATAGVGVATDLEPIGDRDVLQGEQQPLFSRAPTPPPTGSCWKTEPAETPAGVVGSLSRRTC
jgi:uncharacterized membrane protein